MEKLCVNHSRMPFSVQIDPARRLVESRWEGIATAEMLVAYVDQVWADAAVRNYRELIDFRAVTEVQVPTADLQAFAEYSRQFDNPDVPARSAVIAATNLVYGLSRMFSTLRSLDPDDNREFQVFDDFDAGWRWLEENPAD